MLAAATLAAAFGAGATARPGGAPSQLTPPATLPANGGAQAPGPTGPSGGLAAPRARRSPGTGPAAEPAPGPADDAPVSPPSDAEVGTGAPTPGAEEPGAAEPAPPAREPEPPPAADDDPPAAPTAGEVVGADEEPLVPVVVLSAPVSAGTSAPLIDISPEEIAAPQLRTGAALSARGAQADDEGEVLIPIPPRDIEEPRGGDDDEPQSEVPAARPAPVQPQLALTGRDLGGPLAAAAMLVLLGTTLRLSAGPARAGSAA